MSNKYAKLSKADIGVVYKKLRGAASACLHKRRFSKEMAQKRAENITEQGVPMRFYACPHCKGYHLSRKRSNVND